MIKRSQLFTWLLDQMESSESEDERKLILTLGHYINELELEVDNTYWNCDHKASSTGDVFDKAAILSRSNTEMPT